MEKEEKDEFLIKIGERIETKRLELGFSKQKLASEVGTSRSQILRIIEGGVNSSILSLRDICKVLEMDLSELVCE